MADQRRPDGIELAKLRMPVTETAAKDARGLVETVGRLWGIAEDVVESAKLAVSELVTNVVQHARDTEENTLVVSISRSGEMLSVEVHDYSMTVPVPRSVTESDTSGRGMYLVTCFTDDNGTHLTPSGKVVWFEIKTDWPKGDHPRIP